MSETNNTKNNANDVVRESLRSKKLAEYRKTNKPLSGTPAVADWYKDREWDKPYSEIAEEWGIEDE